MSTTKKGHAHLGNKAGAGKAQSQTLAKGTKLPQRPESSGNEPASHGDTETTAMAQIVDALGPLKQPARTTVMQFVNALTGFSDAEGLALPKVVAALKPLQSAQRSRVIEYAAKRFQIQGEGQNTEGNLEAGDGAESDRSYLDQATYRPETASAAHA